MKAAPKVGGFFLRALSTKVKIKINPELGKIVILSDDTLTGRIINYLNREVKSTNKLGTFESVRHIIDDKYNFDIEELEKRAINLHEDFFTDKGLLSLIKQLDYQSSLRVNSYKTIDLLRLLNIFVHITPNRITECNYYKESLKLMSHNTDDLTCDELLKLLFFASLEKNNYAARQLVKKCLRQFKKDDIEKLSLEQLCIICNSTFKTSTKIANNNILEKIESFINDDLSILNDTALFITLIKSIRQNRNQSNDLLSTIACAIVFNKTYSNYSFIAMCHILALYADYYYFDKELVDILVERCITFLKHSKIMPKGTYVTEDIRVKDITRFLWILSSFNYTLDKTIYEDIIVPKICDRIDNGNYDKSWEDLIDSTLYLWILKFQPIKLVPYCFNKIHISQLTEKSKTKHRLNLLLTSIKLENQNLYDRVGTKPSGLQSYQLEQQLARRKTLQRVLSTLKVISPRLEVNKFESGCQIPYINILGITGYKKNIYKTVYVEVLDEFNSLKNTDHLPTGLMDLKLRILDNTDQAVLKLEENYINTLTEKELEDYLEAEIKLVG